MASTGDTRPEAQPQRADLIIRGGYVVTMDDDLRVFPDGAIAILAGRIEDVGERSDILAAWRAGEEIDATGQLVIPGLIDCHNHVAFPALQGLSARLAGGMDAYPTPYGADRGFMQDSVAGLGDPGGFLRISAESTYWATLASAAELIRAGVTTVIDGGAGHPDEIARALRDSGLRGGVAPFLWDLIPDDSSPRRWADHEDQLSQAEDFIGRWRGDGKIMPWMSLVVALGASDELCRGAAALAERYGTRLYSHIAAERGENTASRALYGMSSLERADELGLLNERFLGIHMGWAEDADIDRLVRQGCSLAHCPQSSMRLGAGYYLNGQILKMHRAGLNIGLGSDGFDNGDLFQMMQVASSAAKEIEMNMAPFDAPEVFWFATRGSARAAGMETGIGSLEKGKQADVVIIDRSRLYWHPYREPVRTLVNVGRAADVRHVLVGGRLLLRDGELTGIDEERTRRELYRCVDAMATDPDIVPGRTEEQASQ